MQHKQIAQVNRQPYLLKCMVISVIVGFLSIGLLSLNGCASNVFSAPGMVYNKHSVGRTFENQSITNQISRRLYADKDLIAHSSISVTTYNFIVLLAGQTTTPDYKAQADKIAHGIDDVYRVVNDIQIAEPISLSQQMQDAWLTTKIKTAMMTSINTDPANVKVLTDNGNVYLLGILAPEQAQAAIDVARHTEGVVRVVNLMQYINFENA